jgi:hypothetical protein
MMMMMMMSSGSVGCSFSQSGDICESKWFFAVIPYGFGLATFFLLLYVMLWFPVPDDYIVLGFSALPSLWSFETLFSFFQLPILWSFLNYMLLFL